MLSSFFLLMFVGIKCQVTQVHFAGAEKYCWKMFLCLYVAGQRQICPSCSKIPESSYGVDTLLRYFGHTSQEQSDGKAFCSLALHLFQKAEWLTVLVPTHLSGSDKRAAPGGCAATDTGHSCWDLTQLLRRQRGQLQFSGWILSVSVQELGSKLRSLSVSSFQGILGSLSSTLSVSVRHCSSAIAVGAEAAEGAGQARGRLLLRALPIKCSGMRCGGRKQQTLRHGLRQG